jgi:hypothetical protein
VAFGNSQNCIPNLVEMSKASSAVAAVAFYVWGGSANAIGLGSDSKGAVIVPPSVFFLSLAATRESTVRLFMARR